MISYLVVWTVGLKDKDFNYTHWRIYKDIPSEELIQFGFTQVADMCIKDGGEVDYTSKCHFKVHEYNMSSEDLNKKIESIKN